MQGPRLTPTSYIVLGLLEWGGRCTPYDLKTLVKLSVGNFWTLQHAQLYTEPVRLAGAGYVTEEREEGGRRRKLYEITDRGREALGEWRHAPTGELAELRDHGLLKLFFGADATTLAPAQLEAHREKLAEYEALRDQDVGDQPRGPWLALEAGIRAERSWVGYWEWVLKESGRA
jgi:PadR family transcriptional regulator, regulatory protein AphA